MLVGVLIPQVWKQSYLSELGWRKVYDKLLLPSIIFYVHTPPTLKPPFNPKTCPAPIIGNAFRSTLVIFLDSYIELYRLIWHGQ